MKTIAIALLLAGCASFEGVQMTESERIACAAETCTVWTMAELRKLISVAIKRGYEAGKGSL
jgi:hypothetical protein